MSAKKILVTGASSGIGRATALHLARQGHHVLMAARRTEVLREIAATEATVVGELHVGELDVGRVESVDAFFAKHGDWLGNLDVVVNNAGLALGREGFQDSSEAETERVFETNVLGLLRVTKRALAPMLKRRAGQIVNLGSVAAHEAYAGGTVYCASKAAVHMITDALRHDLGGTGIRVCTVAPGRVAETQFSNVRFRGDAEKAQKVYEGYRILTADDVASIIAWIVAQPAHINVQELIVLPTDQPSATTLAPLRP